MSLDEVRVYQHRSPFRPFTLFLADGRTATVDHPEVILVPPDGDTVIVWEPPRHTRLIDLASIVEIAEGPKAKRATRKRR